MSDVEATLPLPEASVPRYRSSARWAVSAAFYANGFVVGHWAPKIPVLAGRLGITESVLGALVIMFGIGALIALLTGAVLTTRFGSDRVTRWTSFLLAPACSSFRCRRTSSRRRWRCCGSASSWARWTAR